MIIIIIIRYVGAGPVSCVSVARILDSLAMQAMPREDAAEDVRRAAAGRVLRLRGQRALFLARACAWAAGQSSTSAKVAAERWGEALALVERACSLFDQSVEAGEVVARAELASARSEQRLLRVSASSVDSVSSDNLSFQPNPATSSSDTCAKPIAVRPSLFDLAGAEIVKFPSLEGRMKKKGFFSSFW